VHLIGGAGAAVRNPVTSSTGDNPASVTEGGMWASYASFRSEVHRDCAHSELLDGAACT